MKKIFTLVFISLFQIVSGQNTTAPTGTSNEVGVAEGQLSVSLTGAATYNFPIQVAPGLNGVVPQLSLNYSSQSGNGIAGYGWNIGGLSGISRIPSTRFHDGTDDPIDFDALDRFALDGQRLIVKAGTTGVYGANNTVYETENFSNVKITSLGVHPSGANYGPAYFKVEYPDGSWATYGNTNTSRSVMTWAIDYWQNPQTVNMKYFYNLIDNSLNITSIYYGATGSNIQPNRIDFGYGPRKRNEQVYVNGLNIQENFTLKSIQTGIRYYELTHEESSLKYEKLKSITEKSSDETKSQNPTVFEYGDAVDPTQTSSSVSKNIGISINSTNIEKGVIGDFDGDGDSDFIYIPKATFFGPATSYFLNNSLLNNTTTTNISTGYEDIFTTTFLTGNTVSGFKLNPIDGWTVMSKSYIGSNSNEIMTLNFNTYSYDTTNNVIVSQQNKLFTPPNQKCTVNSFNSGEKPFVKYLQGDFNGDGLTDVISILAGKSNSECDIYNPTTFNTTRKINEVFFIDLKKDITTNYANSYGLIPATNFSGYSSTPNEPITKDSKIEVIDFNGDGKSDFIVLDKNRLRVFTLNITNNTLTLLTTFTTNLFFYAGTNITYTQDNSNQYYGDFNGDGKTDTALQLALAGLDKWIFLMSNGINFVPIQSSIGVNYDVPTKTLYSEKSSNTCGACIQEIDRKIWDIQISKIIVKDFDNDGKTDIIFEKNIIHDYTFKRDILPCPNYYPGILNWPSACQIPNYPPYFSLGNYWSGWSVDYTNQGRLLSTQTIHLSNTSISTTSIGFTSKTNLIDHTYNNSVNLNLSYSIEVNTNITKNNIFNLNSSRIYGTSIYSFALARNHRNDVLLKKVTTGNGISENIEYKPLRTENIITVATPTAYNIYKSATGTENLKNIDLKVATGFMVVSKLEKQSKDTTKKQLFAYCGAVSNIDGIGFLGFRSSMRTDWYDDETKIFSNIIVSDISRRGVGIASYKLWGFVMPDANFNTITYLTKTLNTYNTLADALQTNKVFKLKNTKTETWNTLSNTSSESTSVLDVYNNPTTVTTNIKNGPTLEQTTVKTIAYSNQPTASTFVIGRPTSKTLNTKIYPGQADEDTSISEELYTYTNHLLTKIQKRATNSGLLTNFLTEDNLFDAFGNITKKTITVVGETPRITNFEYSATYGSRFLTKSIDVELLETVYTYDPITGLVLTELLPSVSPSYKLLTTNTYDTWGKKIKVKNYLDKEVTYVYARDVEKTLITATSDDGSSTTELYDDLGRKIVTGSKTIDGTWAYTDKVYDSFDRTIKVSEPYFTGATKLWNETTYDEYSRPTQIKAATGKTAVYTYPGYLTTNVNDGTLNKTNVKNALDNVISLTDTPGGTITYKYFANGNLKKTTFDNLETIISQDGWGRKTKLIEPSAGEYNYTYNGFGQALTETSLNGTTTYTYTTIGKLDTKWVKGKPSIDATFSGTNILSTYTYFNLPTNKMLEKVTVINPNDGNSEYSYTYDDFKRVTYTKEEFTIIAPRKFENAIFYDAFGRTEYETSTATINSFSQTKTYFNEYKNGELFKKRENNASGNTVWTLNTRNARGQITSATLGNNLIAQTNIYHDLGYTLQTVHNKIGTPSVNIMTLVNTYDEPRGNMLTRSNSLFNWNETFNYDFQDRLTEFTDKLGIQTTQDYEDNGKIKSNVLGSYKYSTVKPYQNTAIKLSPEGLLEPKILQVQTIKYTAFKAPISIEQSTQRTFFGYNFAQDRSVMYFGNSSTNKLLQPKRRFYSADGTMEITQTLATNSYEFTTYIGGDAYTAPALARQVDNQTSSVFYLHRDHLGTILAISNSLGDVVEKRLFDAWGELIKLEKNGVLTPLPLGGAGGGLFIERGYTGHEHLQQFRLINMNGRLYDPRLHRFLQPDNNLQEPYNTQNYNRYGYCVNNPLKYIDPSGESFWGWFAGVIVKTFFTTAQATGEANPFKWSATTWQNAGLGILSSGVSTLASDRFNSYVDNYGKHLAIDGSGKNPIEGHLGVLQQDYDDWYFKKIQENPNWSPSFFPWDARGYEIFYHWAKGSGKSLVYKNGLWGKYMSNNDIINNSMLEIADIDAIIMMDKSLTKYSDRSSNYAMEIENGYFDGYELLHGTQNFSHSVNGTYDAKSKSYNLNYTLKWNDRINPNGLQGDGKTASYYYKMGAKDYNISITWHLTINVKASDLNNNIYNNGTIHN
jgi:RHS repeat-associated protein